MNTLRKIQLIIIATCITNICLAQNKASGLKLNVEVQGTAASGDYAPLWTSANRHGMGSTESLNAYERVSVIRDEKNDSARNWRLGYGLDMALQEGATSTLFIQQAFAEIAYKKVKLIIGSKEHDMDLKNQELSSGGLSLGINAHPIPQIRMEIDYFSIPGTRQWWKWKVRGSYGKTTDGNWQREFTTDPHRYTSNILYHEKAIYWKFGKEDFKPRPLTFEIGLQMASQFGGTTYNTIGRNIHEPSTVHHSENLNAFWNALICGGSDETDGTEQNVAGNHLGSYNLALAWTDEDWMVRAYAERFFEDQSMITFQYGVQDHIIGIEGKLPKNPFVSRVLIEHLSTRNQSGAIYHDQTASIPDKMNGKDNYYNHKLYCGWQHWGMGIGNPLITSPLYRDAFEKNGSFMNDDIYFYNNRVKAWHIGLTGDPHPELHWRLLVSLTENWGTYTEPLKRKQFQQYCMAEATWSPKWSKGWNGSLALGYDHGRVIGNSVGCQLKIQKSFDLVK